MPPNQPDYQPDQVEILDRAIALMSEPHAVVENYQEFATDADNNRVRYGDPAACRFCVAGVVEHAAMLVRQPGKILSNNSAYIPMGTSEADLVAAACQVDFHESDDADARWEDRPSECQTLIEIFDRAWRDGEVFNDSHDLELIREAVVEYLQRGRDHIASELSGVTA